MSDITEVPPLPPDAGIDELRAALAQLIENQRVRERDTAGEKAAKFITWGDAEAVGLLIRIGGGSVGTGGGVYAPPDDPLLDRSPPEASTNLQAFSSVAYIMVTIDAPTYPQGGGNGYTEIYAANYSGTGPLPTFGDAVLIGTMTGRSPVLVIDAEPGVETHFWAGAVTAAGVKQVDTIGPTGGTNGIVATPGLIDSQHIVSLTASKITAGSIGVGEDITSTGFVSGSAGWRIRGNGAAEFSNVVARGSIYAAAGAIGGNAIDSTGIQSPGYAVGSYGWRFDTSGLVRAFASSGTRVLDMAATGTSPVLKIGSALELLANGDAYFGGRLAVGAVSANGSTTASADFPSLPDSASTFSTGSIAFSPSASITGVGGNIAAWVSLDIKVAIESTAVESVYAKAYLYRNGVTVDSSEIFLRTCVFPGSTSTTRMVAAEVTLLSPLEPLTGAQVFTIGFDLKFYNSVGTAVSPGPTSFCSFLQVVGRANMQEIKV